MDPLKRNNPGVRATNHENRIEALERRIFADIEYVTCQIESFFGTVAANDGFPIEVTSIVDGSENTAGWSIVDGRLHVPNLGTEASRGGGFFQTFCEVEFDEYLGYTVADPFQGGGPTVIMSIWDQDENLIDASFGPVFHDNSIRYDAPGTNWTYAESALFWNGQPFAAPPDGWHVHFQPSFLNDSAVAGLTLIGNSLTVIRYGPANTQFQP